MPDNILFSEKQRFTQWWLWLILLGSNGLIIFGIIQQVVFGRPFGDKPAGNIELYLVLALTLILMLGFYSFKLETLIKYDGIYVRFFPFHISFKYYPWKDIHKTYVRKYNPILEYGGWGIRGLGKNKALNVSGNKGLQLELSDNKKLLIGTRRPDEIEVTLKQIKTQ